MISFITAILLSTLAFAAGPEDEVTEPLQSCFNAIGRANFKAVAYSADTRTLYYEIGKKQIVVLRETAGHEVQTENAAACKNLENGGNLAKLAQQIDNGVAEQVKAGRISAGLGECPRALRAMGHQSEAELIEMRLKNKPANSGPPATVR